MSERSEARLRDALRAEAEGVRVDPQAWAAVQQRVRARRTRTVRLAVAATAAMVAVAVGLGALLLRDDGTTVDVVPADDTTTSVTTDTTTPVEPEPAAFDGIWPFWSQDQVDAYVAEPGVGMFFDPTQTALEFAREYLAMRDPVAPGGFQPAEGASGWVDVRPKPGAPMVTTVWVHRYGDDGPYSVYFAETDNIRVDRELLGQPLGTTIPLAGTSTAFEATVSVEVREDGGRVLGRTFVMGGANGEMGPFDGEIEIDAPTTPGGAIIFTTESAEDGALQEATVVRIGFGDATTTAYSVFFHRDDELVEVRRTGSATAGVLRQALEALVAGPRPDDGDGLTSLFSAATADVLAGVNLRDGTAVVDFARTVDNASSSAGSVAFRDELNATVFQFPAVERIEYRLQGSCDAFWEWQQVGGCELVERPGT